MTFVALVMVALNGVIGLWLSVEAKHDLVIRNDFLHILDDAGSARGSSWRPPAPRSLPY